MPTRHPIPSAMVAAGVLIIIHALVAPPEARAALAVPSCESLSAWAQTIDKKDKWRLNSYNKRLNLTAAFGTPEFEALFGKPALEWTRDDTKAAGKIIKACGAQARKAKNNKARRLFGNANRAIQQYLVPVIGRMKTIRQGLDQSWSALVALPPSTDTLRAFGALNRMGDGGAATPAEWRILTGSHLPPYKNARGVIVALRELPDAATDSLRPQIAEHYEAQRAPVVAALEEQLTQIPSTLEGLRELQVTMDTTRKELGPALSDSDYAALAERVSEQGTRVEEHLLNQEIAAIEAAPETLDGLAAINTILAGPVAGALSEPNADALKRAGFARRASIGDKLIAAEIAKLAEFPGTLEGMHELSAFEAKVLRELDESRTGLSLTGFKHAVTNRFAELGREALPDYERSLDALPENEKGLSEYHALQKRHGRVIQRTRQSTRREYEKVAAARLEAIEKGVAQENARLAALPLPGGVFVQRHGPRFEFRKGSRVYMTMAQDVTVEGEYEEDGERVIIRLPQANLVFRRSGPLLIGNGMELKRQTDS